MRVLQLLLVVLLGALLVQYTLAAATPKAADAKAPSTPEAPKTVKADPPKAEAPKPAAPKEAPPKAAEPPKAEAPKEVPKPKEAPKAEAPKEVPKAEAPKETPKAEAPKEAPKPAAPKETPKEAPKAEAPKEVPKAEVPKETPKAEAPKEAPKPAAPKEAPKAETPKKEAPKTEAPKTETPKPKADTPKPKADTPKTEGKAEPSFVDTYYPIVQDYADQAITTASKYAEVASEYAKEIGSHGAALAGDYYVVAEKNLGEYKKAVEDYTYSQSVKTIDQFLDPQHAQIIKKNYLNWYGVGVVVAAIVGAFLFIKHLTWVLSLTALRAYLSAVSLGIYGTLATLTFLTLRDPADSIKDASKLLFFQTVALYVAIGTTALSALSLLALPGKFYTFIVLVLSSGLFVDQFELRPTLEKAVGAIPPYSLETLVFLLQTILIFDSVARLGKPKTTVTTSKKVEKVVSGGAAPVYIKQEGEIKTEKGSKKGSKAK